MEISDNNTLNGSSNNDVFPDNFPHSEQLLLQEDTESNVSDSNEVTDNLADDDIKMNPDDIGDSLSEEKEDTIAKISAIGKEPGIIPEMKFIPYNTDMERLKLPEYGRKIQELIEYCKAIPDRDERTACANAIADVIARLFPNQLGEKGDRKKIWDHINIMSSFGLDIDFPVEVLPSEEMNPKPSKIEYNKRPIRYRHYGRTIELMVEKAVEIEDGELKDHLVMLIANQMKKQLLAHNKEGVSDAKVFKDLAEYSNGKINLDPRQYPLHEYNELNPKQSQSKKRRKK